MGIGSFPWKVKSLVAGTLPAQLSRSSDHTGMAWHRVEAPCHVVNVEQILSGELRELPAGAIKWGPDGGGRKGRSLSLRGFLQLLKKPSLLTSAILVNLNSLTGQREAGSMSFPSFSNKILSTFKQSGSGGDLGVSVQHREAPLLISD